MIIYVVSLYTRCLRYNICSAWFLDIRILTCSIGLLVFIFLPFTQRHVCKGSFLAFAISVHSVYGPVNRTMWVKGLITIFSNTVYIGVI